MNTASGPRNLRLLGALLLTLVLLPGATPSSAMGVPISTVTGWRSTAATPLPAFLAWGWPLAGQPQVVHTFNPPARPWLSGHRGVDLLAAQGANVLAPVAGVVSFSGVVVDRAVLTIAAADGLRLSFEPVTSPLEAGEAVARGQVIGSLAGPTHCDDAASGADGCLHWGVRRGEDYLDPLQFIFDLRPSVLLPLRREGG